MDTKSTEVLRLVFRPGTSDEVRYEIHLLNIGEHMERFGGRRSGLTVTKTASLIKRVISNQCFVDVEYDIRNPNFWEWLESALCGEFGECHVTKLDRK